MIQRLLIANRGEIACRIIKTCKKMGITVVCVYAEPDKDAPFVALADEAYSLEGNSSLETYLDQDKLLEIAKSKRIDAIHPGYGFLSENADFAQRVSAANLLFVGPKANALETMGSKAKAKALAETLKVPTIPGYHGKEQDLKTLTEQAEKIGFPLLIKASFGGGGKGMRIASNMAELEELINAAKRESAKSFAKDELILEKYLIEPRHIEVQIVRDNHGNFLHFFDRDCSIQRRHQKVVEEAPALELSTELKEKMVHYSRLLANSIDYRGAGTIEFLVSQQQEAYFIEMNTRLQVEHPVTELITGVDLVALQLSIAENNVLPLTQEDISQTGHAIEVRLYAEDPQNEFLPATGTIHTLRLPKESATVRIDHNLKEGLEISHYFDPMLAKLICYGRTRNEALSALIKALSECAILGVKTNLAYLHALCCELLKDPTLPSTSFINDTPPNIENKEELAYALLGAYKFVTLKQSNNPWLQSPSWQMNLKQTLAFTHVLNEQEPISLCLEKTDSGVTVLLNGKTEFSFESLELIGDYFSVRLNQQKINSRVFEQEPHISILIDAKPYQFTKPSALSGQQKEGGGSLNAPMPGTVVAVHVSQEEAVKSGQVLAILEAMKMEHQIRAPSDGLVKTIFYQQGQTVNEGDPLFELEG